ncbi:hypothetical protein FRC01_011440, partial [Tulasnella sp. 417]
MSHSLSQQVSDLKRQLAQQTAECDAIRTECEQWRSRAERESQEKAMLETLLKDSEREKIEWWTKFKELQASGLGEGSARMRKRVAMEDEMGLLGPPFNQSDDEADSVVVPASDILESSLGLLSAIEDSPEVGGIQDVQAMNTAASWPTPPGERIKLEEEDIKISTTNLVRVNVEEADDQDLQYVSGTFPTT